MKTETLLKIHFVALTILGGCLLGGVSGTESLATIALAAGLFSLVFVDWLALVYLPPSIAYLLMGIASVYCVGGFWSGVDERQISAVARLLVLVQAVLHLQKKSRRVFEQLSVFALLELIVAAVLNDALYFGMLLIPFSIVGLSAMVQLQAYISQSLTSTPSRGGRIDPDPEPGAVDAQEVSVSPIGLFVLGPAVLAFAASFFYALPRSSGSGLQTSSFGPGTTGYSDTVRFEQMGKLLQNPQKVMRLELRNKETEHPYTMRQPIYLRGQVLDGYTWNSIDNVGAWGTVRRRDYVGNQHLPREYIEEDAARRSKYDRVEATLRIEPSSVTTIFAIPPYYESESHDSIRHWPRHWLIKRSGSEERHSRLEYSFLTHAFHRGLQSPWLRYVDLTSERHYPNTIGAWERQMLLEIDRERLPNLVETADRVASDVRTNSSKTIDIALGLETFLGQNPDFKYSLDLRDQRPANVDPMDYFVSTQKSGHCQFYAGALALMLRSQGIPARLIVGYKTDEYNNYGEYYIVRQLHAHAWVEAYFERHQLPAEVDLYGQAPGGGVWMRLDATPAVADELATGGVSHMMDFAQILWDDYVLDMSNRRQQGTLQDLGQGVGEISAYTVYLEKIDQWIQRLKAGELGEGSIAIHEFFSWRVTVVSVFVCLGAVLVWRNTYRASQLFAYRRATGDTAAASGVAFFDRMCLLLSRIGLYRKRFQTPREFARVAQTQLSCDDHQAADLHCVVTRLYEQRFGSSQCLDADQQQELDQALHRIESMLQQTPR
ncbi:Protein-glutamine gamma-glutamyltransferase [Rosistilla carotiformis]|uniref:Protein-glutamine gamma-glutamyltransferase n=1 Tax=Rosistilla carotiformis TaxID=2528017 RepID=A0A518JQG3_9BACT|nr:DUF3488 and transglutaminase-like domain-containing protein [Rosistilla carotiformis]QDV67781.1 Protein-glutamine gamma-glutamyltransferase [Rosistilla carotiformis]